MELLKCNYLVPASVNHMQRWFLAVKTNDLNIDIKYNRKKEQQRKREALAAETSPPYEILLVQEDSQSQKGLHNISNLKFIIHHPQRTKRGHVVKNKQLNPLDSARNHLWFMFLMLFKDGVWQITRLSLVESLGRFCHWCHVNYVNA